MGVESHSSGHVKNNGSTTARDSELMYNTSEMNETCHRHVKTRCLHRNSPNGSRDLRRAYHLSTCSIKEGAQEQENQKKTKSLTLGAVVDEDIQNRGGGDERHRERAETIMATRDSESRTHGGGGKIELTYSLRHRTRPRFNHLMTTVRPLE